MDSTYKLLFSDWIHFSNFHWPKKSSPDYKLKMINRIWIKWTKKWNPTGQMSESSSKYTVFDWIGRFLSGRSFREFEYFRNPKLADLKTEFSKMDGHLNWIIRPRVLSGPSPFKTMYFHSHLRSESPISETVYFVKGCSYLSAFFRYRPLSNLLSSKNTLVTSQRISSELC